MRLFQKKITDQEWVTRTQPLLESARAAEDDLVEALENQSLDARCDAIRVAEGRFRELCAGLEEMLPPSSPEVRRVDKELRTACVEMTEGCSWGRKVLTEGAAELVLIRNLGRLARDDSPLHDRTAGGGASGWWGLIASGAWHLHRASQSLSDEAPTSA